MFATTPSDYVDAFFDFYVAGTLDESEVRSTVQDVTGRAPRTFVNVSSGGGSLTDMGGGLPAYRISKVSLNALTRMWAAELVADRILVNSICPGWAATDMGGPGGRPVVEGAAGITWAATLPDNGPTGGFFRDRRPIPW